MKAGREIQIRSSTLTGEALNHLAKVGSNKIAPEYMIEFRAEGKVIFLRPSTPLERLKAMLMPSQARKKSAAMIENVLKEMVRNHWIPQAAAELRPVRSTADGRSLEEQAILRTDLTLTSF